MAEWGLPKCRAAGGRAAGLGVLRGRAYGEGVGMASP